MKQMHSIRPLSFNYIYETPSDFNHPLINTISTDPNITEGWSSVRYCSFPQVLIIKFTEIVSLKQITLLFHQFKIPQQVDVFFFNPTSFSNLDLPSASIPFKRLCNIKPSPNDLNDYKLRELKSILLNVNCLYLKLQLHQCYPNDLNAFNQVALIKVECFGKGIGKESIGRLSLIDSDCDRVRHSNEAIDLLVKDDDFDEVSKRKTKMLKDKIYIEKDREVKAEMNAMLDELRVDAKKIMKLIQLERNYLHLNEKAKAKEVHRDVIEIQKIVDAIDLPRGSAESEAEVELDVSGREYSEIVNRSSKENNYAFRPNDGYDKSHQGFNGSEYQYQYANEVNTPIIQQQSSNDILQKFLLKKKLIEESHLSAKAMLTRENIINQSSINL